MMHFEIKDFNTIFCSWDPLFLLFIYDSLQEAKPVQFLHINTAEHKSV